MDILMRKGREVDHRTSPNSMDSEWCFSKRGRGEIEGGGGICHG